jgi:hypothetical protein
MARVMAGDFIEVSPSKEAASAVPAPVAQRDKHRTIRKLIWLYVILWLIEGGLRRWFLPGLASPLLLIRDPVAILIYSLAISANIFPMNGFVVWGALLGGLSFIYALLLGHGNMGVAIYGVRCDYLHVPLIFVMGKVLRREDIMALARVAVWVAVPYTALLVAQWYQPQDAWVNRGVGGDMAGAGFDGANGHFRPPGTFSFISGPSQLYPLFAACWFALLLAQKLPVWTMIASGGAILAAIPISISRTLFLAVVLVALVGVIAMVLGKRLSFKLIVEMALAVAVLSALARQSPIVDEGMEAFSTRWEQATVDNGGFQGAIIDRVVDNLFGSFEHVNFSGYGTGYSTNVGQKALTDELGFGASEGEWGRLLFDNGFILGFLAVAYRVVLAFTVAFASWQSWREGSPTSLLFTSAAFLIILNGQWGQATTLGSAIIGGGLALAAAKPVEKSTMKISARN